MLLLSSSTRCSPSTCYFSIFLPSKHAVVCNTRSCSPSTCTSCTLAARQPNNSLQENRACRLCVCRPTTPRNGNEANVGFKSVGIEWKEGYAVPCPDVARNGGRSRLVAEQETTRPVSSMAHAWTFCLRACPSLVLFHNVPNSREGAGYRDTYNLAPYNPISWNLAKINFKIFKFRNAHAGMI
jgi:hypothetical protein